MPWFRKAKQPDSWEDVQQPIGDLEAAQKIRTICDAATNLATHIGSGAAGSQEKERYERAAKTAMQLAMKISDDLVRDAAIRRIIILCVKANNVKTAVNTFSRNSGRID
jgi:hypothetical protein